MSASNIIRNGGCDRITLLALDVRKDPVIGATVTLALRDIKTGEFWDGVDFVPGFASVTMVETNVTNCPGEYHYDLVTSDREILYKADGVGIANAPFRGSAQFVDWIGDIIITRKYSRNRVVCDGGRYTVFDDDGNILETGDATIMERKPDGFPDIP